MSLIYQTGSDEDKAALENDATHGFVVTEAYEKQQEGKSLVGWKQSIKKDDMQLWDLNFNEDEHTFTEDPEYYEKGEDEEGEGEYGDEEEEEEEETKADEKTKCDLSWIKLVSEKETYFVLTNRSGRTIKKGEEVFYFYGEMSNTFLLLNYSFAYQGNKYDSYEISLFKDPASKQVQDLICSDYSRMKGIESVKLQMDKLNYTMLCYLRLLFASGGKLSDDKAMFTHPTDIEKEKEILTAY